MLAKRRALSAIRLRVTDARKDVVVLALIEEAMLQDREHV